MDAAAAHTLRCWARMPDGLRSGVSWVAAGPWFERVAGWMSGEKRSKFYVTSMTRFLPQDVHGVLADALARGVLCVYRQPNRAGVEASMLLARADDKARLDLASVLENANDPSEKDLARVRKTRERAEPLPAVAPGTLRVTCDASFHPGAGAGAWAAVASSGETAVGVLDAGLSSSRVAELQAVCEALEWAPGDSPVEVCSDCVSVVTLVNAVVNAVVHAVGDVANVRVSLTDARSDVAASEVPLAVRLAGGDDVVARYLDRIAGVASRRPVAARWVAGHAGVSENHLADALAGKAAFELL